MAIIYSNKGDPSEDTFAALQDRAGLTFNLMINVGFAGIAGAIHNFIPLMPRFLKDYESKLYSPTLFYFIVSLYKVPLFIFLIAIYLAIAVIFINFDTGEDYEKVPSYYGIMFLLYMTCSGIGDATSIIIQDSEAAQFAMLIISLPMFLTAGYLANVKNFILPLKVLAYITPAKYGYQALNIILYDDKLRKAYLEMCMLRPPGCSSSDCTVNQPQNKACDPYEFLDFNEQELSVNVLGLLALFILYRIIALVSMMYVTWDTDMKSSKRPKIEIFENRVVVTGNADEILKNAGINFVAQVDTIEE